MEQIFTQPGVAGQTGIYAEEEASAWGNTDGAVGSIPHDTVDVIALSPAGFSQIRGWYNGVDVADHSSYAIVPNRGFIERRADWRSGGGAANGGMRLGAAKSFFREDVNAANFVKYDYRTTLCIPPFRTFAKDIYWNTDIYPLL